MDDGVLRVGNQEPRIRIVPPPGAYTDGDDAADLCAHYWFTPDPWQRALLRDWLQRDSDGRLKVITAGLAVPRQNGKNGAIEAFEFYLLVTDPNVHILHTAHLVKTCKKAFNRLARIFEDKRHPEILRMVKSIRRTNGEEGIYLWHPDHIGDDSYEGASIEYSARSRGSARGFDKISHIFYDEAQELTDEQVEALMFTLGASETDRFILYLGTPPGPNCPGEVFARVRSNALSNPSPHTSWHEWSIEKCPPRTATYEDVEQMVWDTNPGMGVRLSPDFTREEFANATIDGFARERLGWWAPVASAHAAISQELWDNSAIKAVGDHYRRKTAFAVKFSTDGSTYSVAGAKLDARGNVAFELVEVGSTQEGTRHLAEWLWQRRGRAAVVVIDGLNGAATLCDQLAEMKCPRGYVVRPRASDVVNAATSLLDGLKAGTAAHTTQSALDLSAVNAVQRPIGSGGGWGFGSNGTYPSEPIEACSLAAWAVRTTRRNPARKQVML